MEPNATKKQRPVFIVLALVFLSLFILSMALSGAYLVNGSSTFYIFVLLSPAFGVATLVFAILSKRNMRRGPWIALLVTSIILLPISVFLSSVGSLKGVFSGGGRIVNEEASSLATIENAKTRMPKKELTLHSGQTEGSPFWFFDDDGAIAEQFLNMEFTYDGDYFVYPASDIYFDLDSDINVAFDKVFHYASVSATAGDLFGHRATFARTYAFDAAEGTKLKNMIEGKIITQKTAYEKRHEEALAEMSLEAAIEEMEHENVILTCVLYDRSQFGRNNMAREEDSDKLIVQALRGIDTSKMVPWDGKTTAEDEYFFYFPFKNCSYSLWYYHQPHHLTLTHGYKDPFGHNGTAQITYVIAEADGNALFAAASKAIEEAQKGSSAS